MIALPVPSPTALTQPYWDAAKRRELAFQRCSQCGAAFLYPRPWCPNCWAPDPQWEVASGLGVVIGFSVVHQAPYASYAARVPYVVAIVALSEGPQLMANIVDCNPAVVHVGLEVGVTFEERGDVALPQFSPQRRE